MAPFSDFPPNLLPGSGIIIITGYKNKLSPGAADTREEDQPRDGQQQPQRDEKQQREQHHLAVHHRQPARPIRGPVT